MKMYSLKCPDCGANLDFEGDREFIFCKYCGHKVMIDESDEIKLAKIERRRNKDELEYRSKNSKQALMAIFAWLVLLIIGAIIIEFIL